MGLIGSIKLRSVVGKFDSKSMSSYSPEQLAQNREALYDYFASSNWNKLGTNEKMQCLQALENDFAYQQGRPALPVHPTYEDGYGYYSPDDNAIYVNENLLDHGNFEAAVDADHPAMVDANMQMFDTIAHEGFHGYENYAMRNPDVHPDKHQLTEWAMNEGRYFGQEEDPNRYLMQPQERDAWEYGHAQTSAAFDGIEARNGKEPGRDEYEKMCKANSFDEALSRAEDHDPNALANMQEIMENACEAKNWEYDYEDPNKVPTMVEDKENYKYEPEEQDKDVGEAVQNQPPNQESEAELAEQTEQVDNQEAQADDQNQGFEQADDLTADESENVEEAQEAEQDQGLEQADDLTADESESVEQAQGVEQDQGIEQADDLTADESENVEEAQEAEQDQGLEQANDLTADESENAEQARGVEQDQGLEQADDLIADETENAEETQGAEQDQNVEHADDLTADETADEVETQDTEQEQGAEQADLQEEQPVDMTEGETYDIPKDENVENNEQNEQAEPSEDAQKTENAEQAEPPEAEEQASDLTEGEPAPEPEPAEENEEEQAYSY